MNAELYKKVIRYRTAMATVKAMLTNGIINQDDYDAVCPALAKEYGLNPHSIFCEIDVPSNSAEPPFSCSDESDDNTISADLESGSDAPHF